MEQQPGVQRGCFLVAAADGLMVLDQLCNENRRGWVGPGPLVGHSLLMQRSGGFLVRVDGREWFVDPSVVDPSRPGTEASVSHPLGECRPATRIHLPEEVGEASLHGIEPGTPRTPEFELRHWQLVVASRRGTDRFEVAERVWALLQAVPRRTAEPERSVRPGTEAAHRALAYAVRELLCDGEYHLGLAAVAAKVGSSPSHLSRVFRRVTGHSLTAYRNQLRLQAVLRDLADGARCLRTLAAEYGFADQAHLTRVVRARYGQPPSWIRRLLQPVAGTAGAEPSTDVQRGRRPAGRGSSYEPIQVLHADGAARRRTVRAAGRDRGSADAAAAQCAGRHQRAG